MLGLLAALNAEALSFTYSGTVSSSTIQYANGDTIDAGDTFTLTLNASSNRAPGIPSPSFNLTIGSYFFATYPFEYSGFFIGTDADFTATSVQETYGAGFFRGTGSINMTETGGSISLNIRPIAGDTVTGGLSVFFGDMAPVIAASQPVPDMASTFGLLALGCAAIWGLRPHRKLTPPRA